jgi:hypothetical protein
MEENRFDLESEQPRDKGSMCHVDSDILTASGR